jgi:hypothetical protein
VWPLRACVNGRSGASTRHSNGGIEGRVCVAEATFLFRKPQSSNDSIMSVTESPLRVTNSSCLGVQRIGRSSRRDTRLRGCGGLVLHAFKAKNLNALKTSSEQYLERAKIIRWQVGTMSNADVCRQLLEIAKRYEELADGIERPPCRV